MNDEVIQQSQNTTQTQTEQPTQEQIKQNQVSSNKSLKTKFIIEMIALAIAIGFTAYTQFYPYSDGWGGLGEALMMLFFAGTLIAIAVIILPIVFLATSIKSIKKNPIKSKRRNSILSLLSPLFIAISIVLVIFLSNIIRIVRENAKSQTHSVDSNRQITVDEFITELQKRNLYYNEEDAEATSELNSYYNTFMANYTEYTYYHPAFIYAGDKSDDNYLPSYDTILKQYESEIYPFYVYSALLVLPRDTGELKYAALGNDSDYSNYKVLTRSNDSDLNDYFISCYIVYIDGDIYAVLGTRSSYAAIRYHEQVENKPVLALYPFESVLSEKDTITTYYRNQYHANGSIYSPGDNMSMSQKGQTFNFEAYPVIDINNLNRDTINNYAKQLQQSKLNDAIEYFKANDEKEIKNANELQ